MSSRPKRLQRILEASPELAGLMDRARRQTAHTRAIRDLLPADLAAHLLAAVGEADRLVLLTDSSVWASRLRFATNALRRKMPQMRQVRVRVAPPAAPPHANPRGPRRLPPIDAVVAEQMETLAQGIEEPGLRQALLRLARHSA